MEDIIEKVIYGKIKGINSSDSLYNITIELDNGEAYNIKTKEDPSNFKTGRIYKFKVANHQKSERNVSFLIEYCQACELTDPDEVDYIYRLFQSKCPLSKKKLEEGITSYLNCIENKVIKDITLSLIEKYKNRFYVYPAAQRFHHNYVGGLAYHTLGMLDLAKSMIEHFDYLNKDLLYAGILLHDIGKVVEFSGIENTEYTIEGQLLGHLVVGGQWISIEANKLGYDGKEEVMLLEHLIISHHGQQMFGACKKPQTPEALMLWYIDTIDSKFRVLGEELSRTNPGEFTESIGVLEKTRVYKAK